MKHFLMALVLFISALYVHAQQDVINLPVPQKTGGKALMETLNERQSKRSYTGEKLDDQTLSNLLWAAYGFNRDDKRTVPSSQNRQEIEVFVILKGQDAIYHYDAKSNQLVLHVKGDFMNSMGRQEFIKDASLHLIFVANLDKNPHDVAYMDTGYISQNVYLFCASAGLGTVARGSFDRKQLPIDMKLSEKQEVTLVQPVGVVK